MTCSEFKEKVVELFDVEPDSDIQSECRAHMDQCPECKALYQELSETFQEIQPRTANVRKLYTPHFSLWKYAAAILIFTLGVVFGRNHFFVTPAMAGHEHIHWLEQGISSVQNVGSIQMEVYARTSPFENFAHFSPKDSFIKINMALIRQNDSTFFRVEKEKGRTVVNDGIKQYMWIPGKAYYQGSTQTNFLEGYTPLLRPESLLSMQQSAIKISKKQNIKYRETDTRVVLLISGIEKNGDLRQLLENNRMDNCKVEVENTFSKKDGLLRSVKLWITDRGEKTLILYTNYIHYNVGLDKAALTALPEEMHSQKIDVTQSPVSNKSRKAMLKREQPEDAAERILNAIIRNDFHEAEEALVNYKNVFPVLVNNFKGCKTTQFQVRRVENYPGCHVFYTLIHPDGKKETHHIALRKEDSVWIVDGGL